MQGWRGGRAGGTGGAGEAPESPGEAGSLPPAPEPAASPSGLCPRGRCASEQSRRAWAGGARGGARSRSRRPPRRRYCALDPAAPSSGPRPAPGGGHPRRHGPGAAPTPWRTTAWTQPPSPLRPRGSAALSAPAPASVLRVPAAPGPIPFPPDRRAPGAMNGRRGRRRLSRKVVDPDTCSAHFKGRPAADGGMDQEARGQ